MTGRGPRRRLRRAVPLAVLVLACSAWPLGCGQGGRDLDWDLAADLSIAAVGWKDTEETLITIEDVRRVRIRLPGGLLIDERDPTYVALARHQEQVTDVYVKVSLRESAEAAHRRATAMAQRYHLGPTDPFDHWLERQAPGERDDRLGVGVNNGVWRGSAEKPKVSVRVEFDGSPEERLWSVKLIVRFDPMFA